MEKRKIQTRKTKLEVKRKKMKKLLSIGIMCLALVGVVAFGVKSLIHEEEAKEQINTIEEKTKEIKKEEVKKPNPEEIVPGSNIIYSAEPYAVDMKTVKEIVDNKYTGKEKMVFLTFDDGPSINTEKILNILKEKNVHATFFVLGSMLENNNCKDYLKRTIKEGNALGNHSYSHSLQKLYPNNSVDVNRFMTEYDKTNNEMKKILGEDFDSKVLRMPGGYMSRRYYNDAQLPNFDKILNDRGIVSIDWDSMTGDAERKGFNAQDMVNYLENHTKNYTQTVVLMHDNGGKVKTVEALPQIIDNFKNRGFEFKVIKSTVNKN